MNKISENYVPNKEIFVKSLEKAFAKIGLQEHGRGLQIAKLLDVSPQAVSKWFSLDYANYPKTEILIEIAKITNTSLDELMLGHSDETKKIVAMMPCLNTENLTIYLCENKLPEDINFLAALYDIENGFLLKNPDESMLNAASQPSFAKDILLAFEKEKKKKTGDFVLAQLNTNATNTNFLFRKYIVEGDAAYLVPLNTTYKSYNGNYKIIAVLRYTINRI